MTQPADGILASDADRDAAAEALAEAVAAGRLSLADHSDRLDALFAARTRDQVLALTTDLPSLPVRRTGLYRAVDAHRCVIVGGSAQRTGRFPIGRFCSVTAAFGRFDLDLRAAVPSQREIDLTVWGMAGRIAITVPAGWGLASKVLVLGVSSTVADRDGDRGEPLLRLGGTCVGGSLTVMRA
jgi:hypothetical protein